MSEGSASPSHRASVRERGDDIKASRGLRPGKLRIEPVRKMVAVAVDEGVPALRRVVRAVRGCRGGRRERESERGGEQPDGYEQRKAAPLHPVLHGPEPLRDESGTSFVDTHGAA